MYDQGSMDRIGRLMSLRDLVSAGQMAPDAAPLPMNTLRNNTTGAEYQLESSPRGAQGPQLDYSQPIEIYGQGKGYAIKGQPLSAMINGRRVDYGVDSAKSQAMTQAAQDRAIKLAQAQQDLDSRALGNEKDRIELASLRSIGGAKPLTESQAKNAGFSVRAEDADRLYRELEKGGGGTGIANALRGIPGIGDKLGDGAEYVGDVLGVTEAPRPGTIKRVLQSAPFIGDGLATMSNWTQSPKQQQVEQAQKNFVMAVLRPESGAVFGNSELSDIANNYFPQPNDSPEVVAQKEEARQSVIAALKTSAGHGYEQAKADFEARKARLAGEKKPSIGTSASQTDSIPDPRTEVGTIIIDNATGTRMQSDGKQWRIIGRGGGGGW